MYIPLGGNRKGKLRTVLNRIIVFFFTGLWHGANWTFVFWGLYHGFFLLLEELIPVIKRIPKAIGHIYALLVVTVGFVIFRADTLTQGFEVVKSMFTGFSFTSESISTVLAQLTPWFIIMLLCAVIGCAPIKPLADKLRIGAEIKSISKKQAFAQTVLYIFAFVLFVWCVLRLSSASYNPFIYFRF